SRRRHTRLQGDWSSDVCSSDLMMVTTVVTIMATAFGVNRMATITVTPATAPPVNDTVTIQQALWQAGILKISATSNNPNAILSRSEERRVGKEGRMRCEGAQKK